MGRDEECHYDKSGHMYMYNNVTKISRWAVSYSEPGASMPPCIVAMHLKPNDEMNVLTGTTAELGCIYMVINAHKHVSE